MTDVEEKLLKYLNNCNGHVFGLRPEGSKEIYWWYWNFFYDITVKGETYKGTDRLLKLLTESDVNKSDFNVEDFENCKVIFVNTGAIYRNNYP